nr:WD40 repeat-containing protein [Ipomoea batatas]
MLKLRAFRPTNEKIKKIHVHPTQPWLVTADVSDQVSVWNWEYRQVIYELKAGGVDERRLVGAKLEKLAEGESEHRGKPTEAIRAGSVKQVKFYDDDVRYWQLLRNRSAAAEAPTATSNVTSAFSAPLTVSERKTFFLYICCENKAIFLDLVTMRGRDVPKQDLDNKSLIWQVLIYPSSSYKTIDGIKSSESESFMEFLCRSNGGDGPLVAFGSSDGAIRVLSMITWKLARRYTGGHKRSNFLSDDLLVCFWRGQLRTSQMLTASASFGWNSPCQGTPFAATKSQFALPE